MRNFLSIFTYIAILGALSLTACCKDNGGGVVPPPQPVINTLAIDIESLVFETNEEGEGFVKSVIVTTDAESWDAATAADWLTIEKSGTALNVMAKTVNLSSKPLETVITFTAGNAEPVELPVMQDVTPGIELDEIGYIVYYGNAFRNGTANFLINIFNSETSQGFNIEGLTDFSQYGYSGFEIAEGTYTIAESLESGTMIGGISEISPIGTFVYYMDDDGLLREILVTDGTLTVAREGNGYILTTNFNGVKSEDRSIEVKNIRMRYRGAIEYLAITNDYSNDFLFNDMWSAYSASGTPAYYMDGQDPDSWNGNITAKAEGQYYEFRGGFLEHNMLLRQNELVLDGANSVVSVVNEGVKYNLYTHAFCVSGETIYWVGKDDTFDYVLRYRKDAREIMFGSNVKVEGVDCPVLIGYAAYTEAGEFAGIVSESYDRLTYTLTDTAPAASRQLSLLPEAAARTAGYADKKSVVMQHKVTPSGLKFKSLDIIKRK